MQALRADIPCRLLSWDDCYRMGCELASLIRVDGFCADLIVAIARGGLVPARILSDRLDLFDLTTMKIEHYHAQHKERLAEVRYPLTASVENRRVLLVDDVSDSGDTFKLAIEHLRRQGEPAALRTAVLHHKKVSSYRPDYYVQEIIDWYWVIYPWAVMEDLGSLLQRMEPVPLTAAAFGEALQERHGIDPPRRLLKEVMAMRQSSLA